MLMLSAFLLASATPLSGPPTIVVTGIPISTARKNLEDCIAAHCAADADIGATLAYAEALFVGGDYKLGRSVLRASIARNRPHVARHSDGVAGLYRAYSRFSLHLGDALDYEQATWRAVRALESAEAQRHGKILMDMLAAADVTLKLGDARKAQRLYSAIERDAGSAGLPSLASLASIRHGWLLHLREKDNEALKRLGVVAASKDPDLGPHRTIARILLARIASPHTPPDTAALFTDARDLPANQALVWAPPVDFGTGPAWRDRSEPLPAGPNESYANKWADVAYRVLPDGRVDEVDVLRTKGDAAWLAPALQSLSGRRYTPRSPTAEDDDYRIERLTYTSFYHKIPGGPLAPRDGIARVESLDLTPERSRP